MDIPRTRPFRAAASRWCAAIVAAGSCAYPLPMLQAGDVYRSIDAQGHVVYSDQPDLSVAQTRVALGNPNLYTDDSVRTTQVPPPLRDYEQPPCPGDGYLWAPGYWGWNSTGYYWVPGEWVLPPQVGLLWTPGYWEYVDTVYLFHRGYWATHVGYYGGINYGFGYFGAGFAGGRWVGTAFVYDRSAYARSAHSQPSYRGGRGRASSEATALPRGTPVHAAMRAPVAAPAGAPKARVTTRARTAPVHSAARVSSATRF